MSLAIVLRMYAQLCLRLSKFAPNFEDPGSKANVSMRAGGKARVCVRVHVRACVLCVCMYVCVHACVCMCVSVSV